MTNEIISLIADLAIALSFIVRLVFGIAQVQAAARERRKRLTLETLRNFQTREFSKLIYYIMAHDMSSSSKELRALPAGGTDRGENAEKSAQTIP